MRSSRSGRGGSRPQHAVRAPPRRPHRARRGRGVASARSFLREASAPTQGPRRAFRVVRRAPRSRRRWPTPRRRAAAASAHGRPSLAAVSASASPIVGVTGDSEPRQRSRAEQRRDYVLAARAFPFVVARRPRRDGGGAPGEPARAGPVARRRRRSSRTSTPDTPRTAPRARAAARVASCIAAARCSAAAAAFEARDGWFIVAVVCGGVELREVPGRFRRVGGEPAEAAEAAERRELAELARVGRAGRVGEAAEGGGARPASNWPAPRANKPTPPAPPWNPGTSTSVQAAERARARPAPRASSDVPNGAPAPVRQPRRRRFQIRRSEARGFRAFAANAQLAHVAGQRTADAQARLRALRVAKRCSRRRRGRGDQWCFRVPTRGIHSK